MEKFGLPCHIKIVKKWRKYWFFEVDFTRSGWSYFCQDRKGTNFNFINFTYVTVFNVATDVALGKRSSTSTGVGSCALSRGIASGNRCGNCTSNTSWTVFGILCLVISGMTLIKKALIKIKPPAKAKTTWDSFNIFISPMSIPVMAPNLATPEQIPLQVILQKKEKQVCNFLIEA